MSDTSHAATVEQEQIQKRTFTNWVNAQLAKRRPPCRIVDLFEDFRDGSRLLDLLEVMSGQRISRERGRGTFQHRSNIEKSLAFLKKKSIKLVNINIPDIIDGKPSIILGLIWTIILQYHIEELASSLSFSSRQSSMESLASLDSSLSSRSTSTSPVPPGHAPHTPLHSTFKVSAKKALLLWVREQCHKAGCSINVKDFRASWRSGVVFLAVLSALRPGVVDLNQAKDRSNRQNLEEAFRVAERELHIPRLLEPDDIDVRDPDEKSIMTYVSQFLQYSRDLPGAEDDVQATPDRKAQEVTLWLNQAYDELLEGWESTEGESYSERYHVIQTFLVSFNEQRRPIMPLLTAMRRSPKLSDEQRALRQAWDAVTEKLREYRMELDMSLPSPLSSVAQWLLRTEAALAEDERDPQDHERAAEEAREKQEILRVCLEEMPQQVKTFQNFQNLDEYGNMLVPTDKMDELKRRFTSVRVTAKYHGMKLEYKEHRHSVLDLLTQIRTKLRLWKRPYVSSEGVRVLLQEWHELVDRQELPSLLEAALYKLKQVSEKYSSKSALASDYNQVVQQVKRMEEDAAHAQEELKAVKCTMGRVLSAWDSYSDSLSSLQAWLQQGTRAHGLEPRPQVPSEAMAEWGSRQARLNEAGTFLIESTDPQTSRVLTEELRRVNLQWADFVKRNTFDGAEPSPMVESRPHDLQALIREATLVLKEPLETLSGPLRTYRKRLQFIMMKIKEVDVDSLSPSPECPPEQLLKLRQAVPEVMQTLCEAEQVCAELQHSVVGLDTRLAEVLHWETEARDLYKLLKNQQGAPRGQDPRARALISRGLQLEGQVVTEEQDLQLMVMNNQKNSPLQFLHASALQDRVRAVVQISQEAVGMLSSLGSRREKSPGFGPPPPKVFIQSKTHEVATEQETIVTTETTQTQEMFTPTIVMQAPSPTEPYNFAEAVTRTSPIDVKIQINIENLLHPEQRVTSESILEEMDVQEQGNEMKQSQVMIQIEPEKPQVQEVHVKADVHEAQNIAVKKTMTAQELQARKAQAARNRPWLQKTLKDGQKPQEDAAKGLQQREEPKQERVQPREHQKPPHPTRNVPQPEPQLLAAVQSQNVQAKSDSLQVQAQEMQSTVSQVGHIETQVPPLAHSPMKQQQIAAPGGELQAPVWGQAGPPSPVRSPSPQHFQMRSHPQSWAPVRPPSPKMAVQNQPRMQGASPEQGTGVPQQGPFMAMSPERGTTQSQVQMMGQQMPERGPMPMAPQGMPQQAPFKAMSPERGTTQPLMPSAPQGIPQQAPERGTMMGQQQPPQMQRVPPGMPQQAPFKAKSPDRGTTQAQAMPQSQAQMMGQQQPERGPMPAQIPRAPQATPQQALFKAMSPERRVQDPQVPQQIPQMIPQMYATSPERGTMPSQIPQTRPGAQGPMPSQPQTMVQQPQVYAASPERMIMPSQMGQAPPHFQQQPPQTQAWGPYRGQSPAPPGPAYPPTFQQQPIPPQYPPQQAPQMQPYQQWGGQQGFVGYGQQWGQEQMRPASPMQYGAFNVQPQQVWGQQPSPPPPYSQYQQYQPYKEPLPAQIYPQSQQTLQIQAQTEPKFKSEVTLQPQQQQGLATKPTPETGTAKQELATQADPAQKEAEVMIPIAAQTVVKPEKAEVEKPVSTEEQTLTGQAATKPDSSVKVKETAQPRVAHQVKPHTITLTPTKPDTRTQIPPEIPTSPSAASKLPSFLSAQAKPAPVQSLVNIVTQHDVDSPDSVDLPPALAQAPPQAYTEAYLKAQALARNGFEEAKHCLQEHIMEAINVFEDKCVSAEQVTAKEATLRTLEPELLGEFLRAAKGMEAFCTPAQLRDMELFTQSVRAQWESCFSAEGSFAQAGTHLSALKALCETLSPEDAHRLAQTQVRECETRLAAIQRQYSGETDQETRVPAAFSDDAAAARDLPKPGDKPQPSPEVSVKAAPVEKREVEKQVSVDEEPTKKEALEKYEISKRLLQAQLSKNEQSIQDVPSDSVSLKGLHTRLQEIQFLRQETEALWSDFVSQSASLPPSPGVEQERAELQEQWRQQQQSLQSRGSSLGAALRQIDSTENHMVDFTDRLDRFLRQPKDISGFTLANTNILRDIKELDENLQSELDQLSRLDPESSGLDPRDCFPLSREVDTHRSSLDQLRQQVRKSEAAARALDRFLMSLRTVDQDMAGVQSAPCSDATEGRSKLSLIRQSIDSLKDKAPQLDLLLQGARLTVTQDGVPASCLDMVSSLLRKLEEADAALASTQQQEKQPQEELQQELQQEQPQELQREQPQKLQQEQPQELQREQPQELQQAQPQELQREQPQELQQEQPQLQEKEQEPQQPSARKDSQSRSVGLRQRALLSELRKLQDCVEAQGLKEPTLPAVQHRLRALSDLDSQLQGLHSELQSLTELQDVQGAVGEALQDEVQQQWDETRRALGGRKHQCSVLLDLLKKFQSSRGVLSSTLQRAEQTVGEQASYMGKDNLHKSITKVSEIKQELGALRPPLEELRTVCRQIQSSLKKIPDCEQTSFEAEADSFMDNWLDVTEKTDAYMDNLQVALELWDKQLMLGTEVDSWAGAKLALFAASHPFHHEQQVLAMRDEINQNEENIEHFHRKSAEIQEMLQSQEAPLELQVIETQLRNRMEQVKELFTDCTDVFEELMAVKKHLTEKIEECQAAVENLQTSLTKCDAGKPEAETQIQELCEELEAQELQAEAVLKEVSLVSSVASPQALEALSVDCGRLREAITRTKEMIHLKREERDKGLLKVLQDERQSFGQWFQDQQLSVNECFENPESSADVESAIQRLTGFLKSSDPERRLDQLREQLQRGLRQVPSDQSLSEVSDFIREQQDEVDTFRTHCQNRLQQMEELLSLLHSLKKQHDSFSEWLQVKEKQSVDPERVRTLLQELQESSARVASLSDLVASVRRQGVRGDALLKDSDNLLQRFRNLQTRVQDQVQNQDQTQEALNRFRSQTEDTRKWIGELLQPISFSQTQSESEAQPEELRNRAQSVLESKPEGDSKLADLRLQSQTLLDQGLDQTQSLEVQRGIREAEEVWRSALERTQEALRTAESQLQTRAQTRAELDRDLGHFRDQTDSVQSWISEQDDQLQSLRLLPPEEKVQVALNQALDEPQRRSVEEAARETEEQWGAVSRAAEQALDAAQGEAAALREYEAFRAHWDTLQSWVREHKHKVMSITELAAFEERLQVAQSVLSSKPEGDSRLRSLQKQAQTLVPVLDLRRRAEVERMVSDAEQQWRTALQTAAQAELRSLADDFEEQSRTSQAWIREKLQQLQGLGLSPASARIQAAQSVLSSKPDGDCKVNNLRRRGQSLSDHSDVSDSRRQQLHQTVKDTEEQWRSLLQSARDLQQAAEEQLREEDHARLQQLREFESQKEEVSVWLSDLQQRLSSLQDQPTAADRLHAAQDVLSSRAEGDSRLQELRRKSQNLRPDVEEQTRRGAERAVEQLEEQWAGLTQGARRVQEQSERQCALENLLRDHDLLKEATAAWVQERDQALKGLDLNAEPERAVSAAQMILSSRPEGDSKLSDLRRQTQSLLDRDDVDEARRLQADRALTETEYLWRDVLTRAEEAQRRAQLQYTLHREMDAFRAQASSTGAWVKDLQRQLEEKGLGAAGSQAQIQERLSAAQTVLNSWLNADSQLKELKRRAQSLSENLELDQDQRQELQSRVRDTEEQWRDALKTAEDTQRQLQGLLERLVSCQAQRSQLESRLSELKAQTSGLPRLFPWPGLGERRQTADQTRTMIDQTTALALLISDTRRQTAELAEITQDPSWTSTNWDEMEQSLPALLQELTERLSFLEEGVLTERRCTQLMEQHEAAQDWLREQVKALGPTPSDRPGLQSSVNTLKALLQTVHREQREMSELDEARDSLLNLCSPGGRDALTLDVGHLHDLCATSEQEVKQHLESCEAALEALERQAAQRSEGLKGRASALQWELRSLDQALSYSQPQNNISQLQRHWSSLKNCEKSLEELRVKLDELLQEVTSASATEEPPPDVSSVVRSLSQQHDGLKSRLRDHETSCCENTDRCFRDCLQNLQQWNDTDAPESTDSLQESLEEGEKCRLDLQEALSHRQFLSDCLSPSAFEKLDQTSSEALAKSEERSSALQKKKEELAARPKHKPLVAQLSSEATVVAPPRKHKRSQMTPASSIQSINKSTEEEPMQVEPVSSVKEEEPAVSNMKEETVTEAVDDGGAKMETSSQETPVPLRRKSKTAAVEPEAKQMKIEAEVVETKRISTIILDEPQSFIAPSETVTQQIKIGFEELDKAQASSPTEVATTVLPEALAPKRKPKSPKLPPKEVDIIAKPSESVEATDAVVAPARRKSKTTPPTEIAIEKPRDDGAQEPAKVSPTKKRSKKSKSSPEIQPKEVKVSETKEETRLSEETPVDQEQKEDLEEAKMVAPKRKSKTADLPQKTSDTAEIYASSESVNVPAVSENGKVSPPKRKPKGPKASPAVAEKDAPNEDAQIISTDVQTAVEKPSVVSEAPSEKLEENGSLSPPKRKPKSPKASPAIAKKGPLSEDSQGISANQQTDLQTESIKEEPGVISEAPTDKPAEDNGSLSPTKRKPKSRPKISPELSKKDVEETKDEAKTVTSPTEAAAVDGVSVSPTKRRSKKPKESPLLSKKDADEPKIQAPAVVEAVGSLSPPKRRSKGKKTTRQDSSEASPMDIPGDDSEAKKLATVVLEMPGTVPQMIFKETILQPKKEVPTLISDESQEEKPTLKAVESIGPVSVTPAYLKENKVATIVLDLPESTIPVSSRPQVSDMKDVNKRMDESDALIEIKKAKELKEQDVIDVSTPKEKQTPTEEVEVLQKDEFGKMDIPPVSEPAEPIGASLPVEDTKEKKVAIVVLEMPKELPKSVPQSDEKESKPAGDLPVQEPSQTAVEIESQPVAQVKEDIVPVSEFVGDIQNVQDRKVATIILEMPVSEPQTFPEKVQDKARPSEEEEAKAVLEGPQSDVKKTSMSEQQDLGDKLYVVNGDAPEPIKEQADMVTADAISEQKPRKDFVTAVEPTTKEAAAPFEQTQDTKDVVGEVSKPVEALKTEYQEAVVPQEILKEVEPKTEAVQSVLKQKVEDMEISETAAELGATQKEQQVTEMEDKTTAMPKEMDLSEPTTKPDTDLVDGKEEAEKCEPSVDQEMTKDMVKDVSEPMQVPVTESQEEDAQSSAQEMSSVLENTEEDITKAITTAVNLERSEEVIKPPEITEDTFASVETKINLELFSGQQQDHEVTEPKEVTQTESRDVELPKGGKTSLDGVSPISEKIVLGVAEEIEVTLEKPSEIDSQVTEDAGVIQEGISKQTQAPQVGEEAFPLNVEAQPLTVHRSEVPQTMQVDEKALRPEQSVEKEPIVGLDETKDVPKEQEVSVKARIRPELEKVEVRDSESQPLEETIIAEETVVEYISIVKKPRVQSEIQEDQMAARKPDSAPDMEEVARSSEVQRQNETTAVVSEASAETEQERWEEPEESAFRSIFSEIQQRAESCPSTELLKVKPVQEAPDAHFTCVRPTAEQARVSQLLSRVLDCKNRPATLSPSDMAQQLAQAKACREAALAEVCLLSERRRGGEVSSQASELVEDQWRCSVQDLDAVIQKKESELELVTDYSRQLEETNTSLEELSRELEAAAEAPGESFSEEAERLRSLQNSLEKRRTIILQLLLNYKKLHNIFTKPEKDAAQNDLKNLQNQLRLAEKTVERSLHDKAAVSTETDSIKAEISGLTRRLESIAKDVGKIESDGWSCSDAQKLMVLNAEIKAAHQQHCYLNDLAEDALPKLHWESDKQEIQDGLQETDTTIGRIEEQIESKNKTSPNPIMEKILAVMRDAFAWAKKTETDIEGRRRRVSLLPEDVHHQLKDLKKLQAEVMTNQGQLEALEEEVSELLPQLDPKEEVPMVNASLKSLEELSKSTTERLVKAIREIESGLQTREKLSQQIADLDAWIMSYFNKDALSEPEFDMTMPDLERQARQIHETQSEAERQASICKALLEKGKEIAPELSIAENCYLFERLTNLQDDIQGVIEKEKAKKQEVDECVKMAEAGKQNVITIEKSLRQMLVDLNRPKFPITRKSLHALQPLKNTVSELKSQVELLEQSLPRDKAAELHGLIDDLENRMSTIDSKAQDHEMYLSLRKFLEELKECMKEQVRQFKEETKDVEKYKSSQSLLVQFPAINELCKDVRTQLFAISTDLYPSQLNAEQLRLKQTEDTLNTMEMTLNNTLSIIERDLVKDMDLETEQKAATAFLRNTQKELSGTAEVKLTEAGVDGEYRRILALRKTVELRLRAWELLRLKGRKEPGAGDLRALKREVLDGCDAQLESITEARQSLQTYSSTVRRVVLLFLRLEVRLLHRYGPSGLCSDRSDQIRSSLDSLDRDFQSLVEQLRTCFPQNRFLSASAVAALQEETVSRLLVMMATVKAKAQIETDKLSGCVEQYEHYCRQSVPQRADSAEQSLNELTNQKVTCLKDCSEQRDKLQWLSSEMESLEAALSELRQRCPEQSCGRRRDNAAAILSRRLSRLRRCIRKLQDRCDQRISEWSNITDSVEKAECVLSQVEAELPDLSPLRTSTEELHDAVPPWEQYQDRLDCEHRALSALELRVARLLGVPAHLEQAPSAPLCQRLQAMQTRYNSVSDSSSRGLSCCRSELEQRDRSREELQRLKVWLEAADHLFSEPETGNAHDIQEALLHLFTQKSLLERISNFIGAKYSEPDSMVPAEIDSLLQDVQQIMQQIEPKVNEAAEKSGPVYRLGAKLSEIQSGLNSVQKRLDQKSPTAAEAKVTQKRVWDELDVWHSCLAALEVELQDLDKPEEALVLTERLVEVQQMHVQLAKRAEQRTTLLSKIHTWLQEHQEMINSSKSWITEAKTWLAAPATYTTAKCLNSHVHALQVVLGDSAQIRSTLQSFSAVLDDMSQVCEVSALRQQLVEADREVSEVQDSFTAPLSRLQRAAEMVEAIEDEVRKLENDVGEISNLLASPESLSTPKVQRLKVVEQKIQAMQQTIEDVQRCKTELDLPEKAAQTLTVFTVVDHLQTLLQELQKKVPGLFVQQPHTPRQSPFLQRFRKTMSEEKEEGEIAIVHVKEDVLKRSGAELLTVETSSPEPQEPGGAAEAEAQPDVAQTEEEKEAGPEEATPTVQESTATPPPSGSSKSSRCVVS